MKLARLKRWLVVEGGFGLLVAAGVLAFTAFAYAMKGLGRW